MYAVIREAELFDAIVFDAVLVGFQSNYIVGNRYSYRMDGFVVPTIGWLLHAGQRSVGQDQFAIDGFLIADIRNNDHGRILSALANIDMRAYAVFFEESAAGRLNFTDFEPAIRVLRASTHLSVSGS